MDMSAAALPPIQPPISEKDRQHPLFGEYQNHRASMSRLLVQADSFSSWLYQRGLSAESARICAHPAHPKYVIWLRENVNCKPPKEKYKTLWEWLDTGNAGTGGQESIS